MRVRACVHISRAHSMRARGVSPSPVRFFFPLHSLLGRSQEPAIAGVGQQRRRAARASTPAAAAAAAVRAAPGHARWQRRHPAPPDLHAHLLLWGFGFFDLRLGRRNRNRPVAVRSGQRRPISTRSRQQCPRRGDHRGGSALAAAARASRGRWRWHGQRSIENNNSDSGWREWCVPDSERRRRGRGFRAARGLLGDRSRQLLR